MALPLSLLAATGKHGECRNLCDEAATLFCVGFSPTSTVHFKYINLSKKWKLQRKHQKSKVSVWVRYAWACSHPGSSGRFCYSIIRLTLEPNDYQVDARAANAFSRTIHQAHVLIAWSLADLDASTVPCPQLLLPQLLILPALLKRTFRRSLQAVSNKTCSIVKPGAVKAMQNTLNRTPK